MYLSEFLNKNQISEYLNKVNIFHIILVSFSIHMFVINQPVHEVIDEVHFTNFMRWFMLGIDHSPYQLPGLSVIVSPFVYLFGDNYIAWRLPIILFGMVFLYFYYKVIEHITNKKISLLSTVILSLSPMIFVHSSLMLRDIPVLALGFFSLYLYFKNKYYFSAIVIGLSALIKETAIFFMIFIILWSVIKFNKHNEITIKNFIPYVLLNHNSRHAIKKSIIFVSIILGIFLISLFVYENTVEVLEYNTKNPEFFTYDENHDIEKVTMFKITQTDSTLLEKSINDFNYISKVTDPIHHLNLFFTKGYYTDITNTGNEFLSSFLPMKVDVKPILTEIDSKTDTIISSKENELHLKQFKIIWIQSIVNYSYWLIAFWGIIGLITYAIYDKVKNQNPISNQTLFLILGLTFFIPFLLIDVIRQTYAYYMIHYLPFMALGLILLIHKIVNNKMRTVVLCSFLTAICINFIYYFPIKFLG